MKSKQTAMVITVLILFWLWIVVDNNTAPSADDIDGNKLTIQYSFFDLPDPFESFSGKTYYVALSGNDNSPGTEAKPWRSIQKAADTLKSGERVLVKQGVYKENVSINKSGRKNNYIIFQAYNGAEVIINEVIMAYNDGDQECISVAGCDGFIIRNNHVHDINRLGIYVDAWDTHTYNISVYNNTIHDCKGDPGLVNPDSADFRLKQGSLALDKAQIKAAPPFDFNFQDRENTTACDLGAIEQ